MLLSFAPLFASYAFGGSWAFATSPQRRKESQMPPVRINAFTEEFRRAHGNDVTPGATIQGVRFEVKAEEARVFAVDRKALRKGWMAFGGVGEAKRRPVLFSAIREKGGTMRGFVIAPHPNETSPSPKHFKQGWQFWTSASLAAQRVQAKSQHDMDDHR